MEAIFNDFGIQPILLAAQVVNFLVLLFLLKRFLYKPILKVLDDRKNRIQQSLKDIAEIERKLQQTTEAQEQILAKAAKDAQEIIGLATKSAEQIIQEAHQKAANDTEILVENTRQSLLAEKDKLSQEVRSEAANLIALGFEKITGKVLTKKDQEDLVKTSIKDI